VSYTWKEFKDEVKSLLTTDGNRRGATTFVDLQIRAAVLDLQRAIQRYRVGHEDTYRSYNYNSTTNPRTCSQNGKPAK
jgi:hypothetical protein